MTAPTPTPTRSRTTRRRLAGAAVATLVLAGGLTAWQSTIGTPSTGPSAVAVEQVPEVGDVLVDGQGKTLYLFEPDAASSVTCTGGCADKWPPLLVSDGPLPTGEGVRADLLGEAESEEGASVVTYAGWPLYRYASDDLGEATGHDVDENGGVWSAVTVAGTAAG